MSGLDYQASWTAQDGAGADIGNAVSSLQDSLAEINSQTDALLALWNNSDSESTFVDRQTQWTKAAEQIRDVLNEFKTSMHTSAGISSDTEAAAARTMARGG